MFNVFVAGRRLYHLLFYFLLFYAGLISAKRNGHFEQKSASEIFGKFLGVLLVY